MLIVELKSCSMLSMMVGILVRIEKIHLVLVFSLAFGILPPVRLSAKYDSVVSIFFCTLTAR